MSKEEEFVKKYLDNLGYDYDDIEFIHVLDIMEQYAAEVSRERAEDAFKAGMVFQEFDTAKDFDEWWDWLKEQEEQ